MGGFDPISAAVIGGGLNMLQGTMSNMSAMSNYDDVQDALAMQRRVNIIQTEYQSNVETESLALDLAEFIGSVANNSLDRGITGGNTAAALQMSAVAKAARSKDVIDAEEVFQIAGIYQNEHAQALAAKPDLSSPIMNGIAGGIQGYDAALSRKLNEAALDQYTNASNTGVSGV